MDELFGVSMNWIMAGLLAILLPSAAVILVMAWRNRIMVKLGLRNIPRRPAQTALIIVGIMISTLIMAAAFGTGDPISYSIRPQAINALGPIDEIILSKGATTEDRFGTSTYLPYQRFLDIKEQLAGLDTVDGLSPGIGEFAPVINTRTNLSEGKIQIAGVDGDNLAGFGELRLLSGGQARLEDLRLGEVFLNEEAAEELEAIPGDQLRLFLSRSLLAQLPGNDSALPQGSASQEGLLLTVVGIVKKGGLAGPEPTIVMPLERAQAMLGREGQINSIAVSNRGDAFSGAEPSEEVTKHLRLLFAHRPGALRLKELLDQPRALAALEERAQELGEELRADVKALVKELERPELSDQLISLLADTRVSDEVLKALNRDSPLASVERQAVTLFEDLGELEVLEIKKLVLDEADRAGSSVTSFFVIMGLFSIMVGVLLIFLIFVMLAAARRTEMGMARAVGAKQSHLVQMFIFEGTAYSVVSGAVGVFLGLGASALIVVIANRIFAGGGGEVPEDFQLIRHFEVRSAVVAYSLGMVITFATVAFSAYRVSRMNIVVAIRGLPEAFVAGRDADFKPRLLEVGKAVIQPALFAYTAQRRLRRGDLRGFFISLGLVAIWLFFLPIGMVLFGSGLGELPLPVSLVWVIGILVALVRFAWPYVLDGWLTFAIGVGVTGLSMLDDSAAWFRIGVSLMVIGLGQTIRFILKRTAMRPELQDRLAYTFIGVLMLAFWVLPFDSLRKVAGDLEGGVEMFFISGIAMVAAAVWTVMYNADLLLRLLTFISQPVGRLRPMLVTSVAYPMSAKFRTGLTLAMFALVIFTLIVMSILTKAFTTAVGDVESVAAGWDLQATVNFNTPIQDLRRAIREHPDLEESNFLAVGGYTGFDVGVRQLGAENQRWRDYEVRAADDDFLGATEGKLKLVAEGYGDTDHEVWQALRENTRLAIVDSLVVPSRSGFDDDPVEFQMEGIFYEDDVMDPIEVEVREPRTGVVIPLTVIGVMDRLTDAFGTIDVGMFVSRKEMDKISPFPIPVTTYRLKLSDGVDPAQVARNLEAAFQRNGMETEVLKELVEEQAAANRAFNYLFTGFMGLGLLVGIAALGVVSLRAVVERRQQIGVQRAIGYRRVMVQVSFLLESSFVVLLGVAIGVSLGTIISYNIVNDIRDEIASIKFAIPWLQIGIIIGVAYVFSLVTTFLPARQASRIYPAEALRYE